EDLFPVPAERGLPFADPIVDGHFLGGTRRAGVLRGRALGTGRGALVVLAVRVNLTGRYAEQAEQHHPVGDALGLRNGLVPSVGGLTHRFGSEPVTARA